MASLAALGGPLYFSPVVPNSEVKTRGKRRVNPVSGSLRSSLAARYKMAMLSSIFSFPGSCRNVALNYATKVNFVSSSTSRSLVRCNAKQEQSGRLRFGAESVRKRGSEIVAEDGDKQSFQRSREDLQISRKSFWQNFSDQHVVYKHDRDQWGLGLNPIFTIHEDEKGNRYQVDIDEKEILRRSGVDPNMAQFADEECRSVAEKKITLAKSHAINIQLGLVNPSPLSIVYQYRQEGVRSVSSVGNGLLSGRHWSISGGAPWQVLSLLVPLLSLAILGMGMKWLFSRRKQDEDPDADEDLILMQMRKLKSQMSRESVNGTVVSKLSTAQVTGDKGVDNPATTRAEEVHIAKKDLVEIMAGGQAGVNDEVLQRKVSEIRLMARNARLREQNNAERRSPQRFERTKYLEQQKKEREGVEQLENLAKDLDDFPRSIPERADGSDLPLSAVEYIEERNILEVEDIGKFSVSQLVTDNVASKQSESLPSQSTPNSALSSGVKPRIILSAEEARARIAAKRVRSDVSSPISYGKSELETFKVSVGQLNGKFEKKQPSATDILKSVDPNELKSEVATTLSAESNVSNGLLDTAVSRGSPGAGHANDSLPDVFNVRLTESATNFATVSKESSNNSGSENLNDRERRTDRSTGDGGLEKGERKSNDEKEEMKWMRDEVLRDIVFKVQANEEAGREPFYHLNSEQETLFFKGLERKFEREGDDVKKWIKDRVENIDYGSNGISLYDPPESYELKWKEGADETPKSKIYDRFSQDRDRIIDEKRGLIYPSASVSEEPSPSDSKEKSRLSSSIAPSPTSSAAPLSPVSQTSLSISKDSEEIDGRSRENGDSKTQVSVSSNTIAPKAPYSSTSPSTRTGASIKENWNHTKRWAKDLERKYAMEKDPAARALMREIGQDLERWITEDEIEAASRMLDNGVQGEGEYVKMHYERTKGKIKKQREIFGREAMLKKYSEYKEEVEEVELWWLSLPFVVCIGLQATVEGERQAGLYSVDLAAALDGVPGLPRVAYHTLAFQDRGDARNFCTLINSQPEKLSADGAEPIPFDPQELYKDAKLEGFNVTVIKKGQLQLSVDKSFEEVESQILELGSARYVDEVLSNRMIDMGSVVDDGLGFGHLPQ